ncbi:HD domain-containing protein [Vibrio sp. 10N.261.52.E6]|uniref:HD domain-containing protein n=2 Tax=unclassified Vibrio TaxID=2614977 RepID=UPI00354D40BE
MFNIKNEIYRTECEFDSEFDSALEHELKCDEFYKKIIESQAFTRLLRVSFLGAIDYVYKDNKQNRYKHSLDVAKLALYVCKERGYNKETQDHIVAAALLHDIGHAPFSHSMEPSFAEEFGVDHHIAGHSIVNGKEDIGKSLKKILDSKVNSYDVLNLMEQNSNEEFSDIFNSPINVDTIDGIHKSLGYLPEILSYNKYSIAKASFCSNEKNDVKILDQFWHGKNTAYKLLINSGVGAVADHMSREYFHDNKKRIDESSFYKNELSLLTGIRPIFKDFSTNLHRIKPKVINSNSSLKSKEFDVVERDYYINLNVDFDEFKSVGEYINNRFLCNRKKVRKNIKYFDDVISPNEQFKLI